MSSGPSRTRRPRTARTWSNACDDKGARATCSIARPRCRRSRRIGIRRQARRRARVRQGIGAATDRCHRRRADRRQLVVTPPSPCDLRGTFARLRLRRHPGVPAGRRSTDARAPQALAGAGASGRPFRGRSRVARARRAHGDGSARHARRAVSRLGPGRGLARRTHTE